MPVLAVGAGGGPFTAGTMSKVTSTDISSVLLDGVGHYAAMEAPKHWRRPFSASLKASTPPPPDHSRYRLDELDSRTARTTGFKRDSEVPLMRRERAKDRARNKRRHTLQ